MNDIRTTYDFWKLKSLDDALELANKATQDTGEIHLAYDYGTGVAPRYGICQPPKIGDEVSYAFNGDYYPDGKVKTVSDSYRVITTDTGHRFYRRKLSPSWIMAGGTWSLVHGHIYEQNPCF